MFRINVNNGSSIETVHSDLTSIKDVAKALKDLIVNSSSVKYAYARVQIFNEGIIDWFPVDINYKTLVSKYIEGGMKWLISYLNKHLHYVNFGGPKEDF